jgi:hypothetical protein
VEVEHQKQQHAGLQEKARKDSLEALTKYQEGLQARLEADRKRHDELLQKERDRVARIGEERQNQQQAALQEKARRDSLDALAKRQEQLARSEAERKRQQEQQQAAFQEKVRRDSLDALAKRQEQQARLEAERRRQQEQQQAALQEKARRDSLDALAKRQEQLSKAEDERRRQIDEQQKEKDRIARAEDERQKQLLAQQEKARRDSIEGQRKQQEQVRQKQQLAQEEKARKEALEKQKQLELAKAAPPPAAGTYVSQQSEEEMSKEAKAQHQAATKAVTEYLKTMRDNQKKAQEQVMELYDLLDKKQASTALGKFKENRKFIAQYVDVQVFNTLEQSIAQAVMEAQPKAGAAVATNASPQAEKPASREAEYIERINSFMRDNKVEAAYAEFKRVEGPLRHYMTGEDFKQLKGMVENAYKIRKKG